MTTRNKHIGSDLDDLLAEDGVLADVEAAATKRVLAHQIKEAMEKAKLTKSALAKRMQTSRAAVDRLLDPDNSSVTLHTLEKAAHAVGHKLLVVLALDRANKNFAKALTKLAE